jgi:BirA family biotin operon repressor/biotin-[acetyl-CoA-carboxylase] ligase
MGTREELARLLADGNVHSGSALARELGCSRTAVWKHLHQLQSIGLEMTSVPGRGYKLETSLELLDSTVIRENLHPSLTLESLDVFTVTDSTNERLRSMPLPGPGQMRAVLAEYQSGGRGRQGRAWLSPFGSGLCLSVGWCFGVVPRDLPALSLASGVAVTRALRILEPDGLGLKWPNDMVAGGGKLGGLLVDVQGESGGPISVIIGVGINFDVSDKLRSDLSPGEGLPPTGLRQRVSGQQISRNVIAADLIREQHSMLVAFGETGFDRFVDEWRSYDSMHGKRVTVRVGPDVHSGVAAGIATNGALLLKENGRTRQIVSGEVTLRPAKDLSQ